MIKKLLKLLKRCKSLHFHTLSEAQRRMLRLDSKGFKTYLKYNNGRWVVKYK